MQPQKKPFRMQVFQPLRRFLSVISTAILISGCGGGGSSPGANNNTGDQNNSVTEEQFSSATIQAGPAPKQITFSWTFNGNAAGYRLESNPDGVSGYHIVDLNGDGNINEADELASDAEGFTMVLPLHLTDPLYTRYQLVAIDASSQEIARSDEIPLLQIRIESLVGYIKASNAEANDRFGDTVALSADGSTLAVGAFTEDSGANDVSIDGTGETDNSSSASGAVYVFTKVDDIWSQQAYIKASNGEAGDYFGSWALAISADGNTLAVGASDEDSGASAISNDGAGENDNSVEDAGAVYIFQRTETNWEQQAYIKASNPGPRDSFGVAVAIAADGNILVVGAHLEDGGTAGISSDPPAQLDDSKRASGAAYIFQRSGTLWSQETYIKASNPDVDDFFGTSVAISADGNSVAIGAIQESSDAQEISTDGAGESDNSRANAGATYLFTKDDTGWRQEAYIKGSETTDEYRFGETVSLSPDGTTLAVTAISDEYSSYCDGYDVYAPNYAGAVYIFARGESGWSEEKYIKPDQIECDDFFGDSLSLSTDGSLLAIGAPGEDGASTGISTNGSGLSDNSSRNAGAVYLYQRSESEWSQIAYIKAPNTDAGDLFGSATALSSDGKTLVIGASGEDSSATGIQGEQQDNEAKGSGAVYVY
ncbi:FG-GAP repeat protein [Microbulbifer agarilyticus]|uniref:FG-GAP repeat protein n=1 Tax=Microbulbifer agarilyticus TaxID=260552 RepID=UPI001C987AEE|nr:FG-GAP repeat protein [Microbulbifer agarilyticus]MBY6210990.1 FG-GAP repeat protein [Microbulbifer agarilyticus]